MLVPAPRRSPRSTPVTLKGYGPGAPPPRWRKPPIDPDYPPVLPSANWSPRGQHLRRITAALALSTCLLGCGSVRDPTPGMPGEPVVAPAGPLGEPVPLVTANGPWGGGGSWSVMDVIADPAFGTVNKASGSPLTWPTGFTARRTGTEVAVLDTQGTVVLTTGERYWLASSLSYVDQESSPVVIIGMARRCPAPEGPPPISGRSIHGSDCHLGSGPI
jgi:hypothetical protein